MNFIDNETINDKWLYTNRVYTEFIKNLSIYKTNNDKILKNYCENDFYTIKHMIPDLEEDMFKQFHDSVFLYLEGLKMSELLDLLASFENYKITDVKTALIENENIIKDLFYSIHNEIVITSENKDLKCFNPLLIKGELTYKYLDVFEFRKIYHIIQGSLKRLNNTKKFYESVLILKKLYLITLIGE